LQILGISDFSGTVRLGLVIGGETHEIKFKESHFFSLKGALSAT
jgi:hypothetical protein